MVHRYVTFAHKPKSADMWDGPDAETYLARTVFEPEPKAIRSGILDASGNDIYCIEEMDVIGFVRWDS